MFAALNVRLSSAVVLMYMGSLAGCAADTKEGRFDNDSHVAIISWLPAKRLLQSDPFSPLNSVTAPEVILLDKNLAHTFAIRNQDDAKQVEANCVFRSRNLVSCIDARGAVSAWQAESIARLSLKQKPLKIAPGVQNYSLLYQAIVKVASQPLPSACQMDMICGIP